MFLSKVDCIISLHFVVECVLLCVCVCVVVVVCHVFLIQYGLPLKQQTQLYTSKAFIDLQVFRPVSVFMEIQWKPWWETTLMWKNPSYKTTFPGTLSFIIPCTWTTGQETLLISLWAFVLFFYSCLLLHTHTHIHQYAKVCCHTACLPITDADVSTAFLGGLKLISRFIYWCSRMLLLQRFWEHWAKRKSSDCHCRLNKPLHRLMIDWS